MTPATAKHQTLFSSLSLSEPLLDNLQSLNFKEMTPVQAESLPAILTGRDVLAQAKTGSGKTAAFGLGLLQKLNVQRFRIQSLVLCPTRELADQVANEIRRLARAIHNIKVLTLCGGKPFGPQLGSLEHGAHIVVGTPGRIEEHLRKGSLSLEHVDMFVLDEADRMLEMGFQDALDAIVAKLPVKRQTLLFSATFPSGIEAIAKRYLVDAVNIKIEEQHTASTIQQHFYQVETINDRIDALHRLLKTVKPESAVVFCNTKAMTEDVVKALHAFGFSAKAINGDLEQKDRDQVLALFSGKALSILVATDVAARGLDISGLDAVFNFELSRDPEVHVHRIGRTGRAGESGAAYSFFGDKESYKVSLIADECQIDVKPEALPEPSSTNLPSFQPLMACLQIDGGKRDKLRPGDILGGLTSKNTLQAKQIGKITVFPNTAYVSVEKSVLKEVIKIIGEGKMKGRKFKVRQIRI